MGKHRLSSGAEPNGKRARPSVPSWLRPNEVVELAMTEEGYTGSLFRVKVLEVSGAKARVEHEAFNEEGPNGEETEELLKEWVEISQLSPKPPPPPPGFYKRIKVGTPVEILSEDGWWKGTLLALKPGDAAPLQVGSVVYENGAEVVHTKSERM